MHGSSANISQQNTDPELQQSVVRFLFLIFGLIFFGLGVYYEYYPISFVGYAIYGGSFAIYCIVVLFCIKRWPAVIWRRYLVLIIDIIAITFGIVATGVSNSPLFILYIWIMLSQALRFGRHLLFTSQVACLLAYFFVLIYYGDYREHMLETAFLILTLIVLPFYLDALLRMLHRARLEADLANRSKSMFLANMSHELRTPLNAIIGYSEMLKEDAAECDQKEYAEDLNKIFNAGNHLLDLINDILDLSKIEAGKMEIEYATVDIKKLVEEVIATSTPLAARNNNRLVLHIDPKLQTLRTDATKIRQTLYNLISNASKFTSNGSITVRVTLDETGTKQWVRFEISDTGIGIPKSKISKLFSPFTQADASTTRKYGGTGLGLAISKHFIDMLKGEISIKSLEGKGTTFTIKLPL